MLQQMRTFSKSIGASLFMGVVALSFVVWGIADIFRGGTDTNVVTVGSTQIPYDMFVRDYRNFLRNQSQRQGSEITTEQARKMGLGDVMLQQVINRAAIDNVVDELGLTAGDADVSARIRAMSVFNGALGGFDRDIFQRVLSQRGYTEQEFVNIVRADMARDQLMGSLASGFTVPPGYAHALFAYSTEIRATEYVLLPPQAVGPIAAPTNDVLEAFVKARPERFSTPEYRDVSYAQIGPQDVMAGLKVSDDQLRQAYDERKSTYIVPEKRDVEQIGFSDQTTAAAARAKLDAGMTFDMLAKTVGKPLDNLGTVVEADLADRGAAVFALPSGGISAPLKNLSGWVLMHVSKITPGSSKSFDEAKPELSKDLLSQLAQSKITDIANTFTDAVSGGADLAEAAKKAGMKFYHVAAVDAQGFAPDGSKAALPVDPELLAQIFNAEVGESGDPFQTKTGNTYAIAVGGTTPPKVKPIAVVHDEAMRVWLAQQSSLRLKDEADALAAQARRDGSLDAIARKIGAPIQSGPPLGRQTKSVVFLPGTVAAVFRAPPGGVVTGVSFNHDGYVIVRVKGILHPALPPDNPNFQQGVRQLAGQMGEDIAVSLAQTARGKQGVKINQKMLDQALGGEGS